MAPGDMHFSTKKRELTPLVLSVNYSRKQKAQACGLGFLT